MAAGLPRQFEYRDYLRTIIGKQTDDDRFFAATEKDFVHSDPLTFPYRSRFYAFGLLHKGNCTVKVGIQEYAVIERCLTLVGPDIVRQWTKYDPLAENHTFFFTPDVFESPVSSDFLLSYPFFRHGAKHVFQLLPEDYEKATLFIQLLNQIRTDKKARQGVLLAFLEWINRIYNVAEKGLSGNNKNQKLCNAFNALLSKYYQDQKDIGFYAAQLNVTGKYLSDIVKKQTGLSAKQNIESFLMSEAKSLLRQTDMTIKEIAFELGYEDASYFVKIFKAKEGLTPLLYRNR